VDPLVKAGSHVDLSRIVDDIMGSGEGQIRPTPGPSSQPQAQAPPGAGSYLMAQDPHPPAYSRADPSTASYSSHSRDGSVTSQTGLLAALPAGAAQPKKSSPLAKTIAMADGSVRGKVGNRGGPPAIHWLKRSPRNNPPSLEKGE
jgi:hypothetical protein